MVVSGTIGSNDIPYSSEPRGLRLGRKILSADKVMHAYKEGGVCIDDELELYLIHSHDRL